MLDNLYETPYNSGVIRKESVQMNMNDVIFCEDENNRINAEPAQGPQSTMVQSDMKAYALKTGLWPSSDYNFIINAHAENRGWTQEGFTGMEIIQ